MEILGAKEYSKFMEILGAKGKPYYGKYNN
jgi:hypothetical protein